MTRVQGLARAWPRHRVALGAILLVASALNLFRLTREGYSNPYYATTVKSMLTSWRNFFYASYDPGGFVTVDKPPLGFWIQAASAKLFGFHGWSLLLPQALAGVLAVLVLYHLVRRAFGVPAGLLAALALAVTPISVATNRNNTVDGLLVLTLLLAAWAVVRAVETGRLRWLLLGATLVGLGFNIKMLQAYLVVPALWLLYLVAAPLRRRARVAHLGLATVVLLVVSLAWAVALELTPADERPYVGGSRTNSALELAFGYNGLERLLGLGGNVAPAPAGQPPALPNGQTAPATGAAPTGGGAAGPHVVAIGGPGGETGGPGLLRLVNEQLAGQISWLLPLALLGLVAAGWQVPIRRRLDRRHQALLLWGTWLLTGAVFFSVAGFWHRYYLVMLAPAIAALAGAGAVALWDDYRSSRRRGWLLPAALLGMAAFHAFVLADFPTWNGRLTPAIVGLSLLAAVVLVAARLTARWRRWVRPGFAVTAGMLALLIAPTVWAALPVWNAPGDPLPAAGPRETPGFMAPVNGSGPSRDAESAADPKLVAYLRANRGDARYLVATRSSADASPLILATGEPVMALGGFGGADQILGLDELKGLVARGEVRFFLLQGEEAPQSRSGQGFAGLSGPGDELGRWVREHCTTVPTEQWRSGNTDTLGPGGIGGGSTLYDCGSAAA